MTLAVCIFCGSVKFWAFAECAKCGKRPESDKDLIYSIALTDHYHDVEALMAFGEKISGGLRPDMSPEQSESMLQELQEMKKSKTFRKMMGFEPDAGSK